ncbi:MAG: META domain-containing protein [Muribaculaceae bacterium]|nr:META domain-containing protein [Muribaculaceae bacterium]
MKLKSYIPALILAMLSSASCSTISSITGSGKKPDTEQSADKKSKTTKTEGKQRGKRKRNTTAKSINTPKAETTIVRRFTPDDSITIARQLAGEWTFDIVAGIKVTGDEERPSLTFDENTNRFYASNGCNYFNGSFGISSFNSISFNDVISTLNMCDDIRWADYITAIWNATTRFYITTRGSEEYLDLRDSNDRTLATLRRHQLSDLNGLWSAVEINGASVSGEQPTIVIDLLEHTVHGNTGCNLFNGTIYQNPDTDRSVQFLNMAVTRMACSNTAVETAFLVALEQTEQATVTSTDQAVLYDKSGRPLIRLQRTSL